MIVFNKSYNLPPAVLTKIEAVNSEDPAYAADKLMELAEENPAGYFNQKEAAKYGPKF